MGISNGNKYCQDYRKFEEFSKFEEFEKFEKG